MNKSDRFRPLLAPSNSPMDTPDYFEKIPYPLLASPKLDGIRCLIKQAKVVTPTADLDVVEIDAGYKALSRTMEILPSIQVQEYFSRYYELDGELIVGDPSDYGVYNRTQSHVMSVNKPAQDLHFYVFDTCDEEFANARYEDRLSYILDTVQNNNFVSVLEQTVIQNKDQLVDYESMCLQKGFEGVMLRSLSGYYKWNRATFRDHIIYKLKRHHETELTIVGFEEMMKNNNVLESDERGYAKRSTEASGLTPAGTLGKFICAYNNTEIPVACGSFTHAERQAIWNEKEKYLGLLLKVRYFGHGMKDTLRHPRARGFRNKIDM